MAQQFVYTACFPGIVSQSSICSDGSHRQYNAEEPACRVGWIYPMVAKVGGLQSQGGKCEAVAVYCVHLPTKHLETSGFPEDGKRWHPIDPILQ